MKKFFLFVTVLVLFSACDKVQDPIVNKLPPCTGGQPVYYRDSNFAKAGFRKIILEDYTGQTCPNCPTGTRIIKNNLIPRYQDTLIVLAIHQGNTFAAPQPPKFTNDFRTEDGETWASSGGFGVGFYPAGIINRKKYASSITLPFSAWASNMTKANQEPMLLKMDVRSVYEQKCRNLQVSVRATCIGKNIENNVRIIFCLVQENIVGPQVDGSKDIEEYEFEHMFRGCLNGTWGEQFINAPLLVGDYVEKQFPAYFVPEAVKGIPLDDTHTSVVVIAYNETSREVLQAETIRLRPGSTKN